MKLALPRRLAGLLAVVLVVAGCGSSGRSAPAPGPSSGSVADSAGNSYVNPIWDQDFPDPSAIAVGGTFYAYATQGNQLNIQTLTSTDLVHWRPGPDALPQLGRWASTGNTWAPEVLKTGAQYSLYYVARDKASDKQCIGRAVAAAPGGPFRDEAAAPLVCQARLGGSIDPDPVRDTDGSLYLYWKNDGNCCNLPVHLWGQRLSSDGSAVNGEATALLTNTKSWQGNLIEAPELAVHDGHHTLFYSANDYASDKYAIGYATCTGPLGPCTDRSSKPLVASNDDAAGPGHCFALQTSPGHWQLLFHAWPPDGIGSQSPGRQLWLEPLSWHGETPVVPAPDAGRQPAPLG